MSPSPTSWVAAALAATALAPTPVHAELFELYAHLDGGLSAGVGVYGERRDDAFHAGTTGLSYGGLVGVELAFLDLWIEHQQYLGGSGIEGTWTQLMAGFDVDFDLSEETGGDQNEGGGRQGAYAPWFGTFGLGLGFGMGTGQQVDPPLDNSEITDKGLLLQGTLGVARRLTRILSVGARLPVQVAYLLKSGSGAVANDISTHYGSVQGALLVDLRFHWSP